MADKKKLELLTKLLRDKKPQSPAMLRDYIGTEENKDFSNLEGLQKNVSIAKHDSSSLLGKLLTILGIDGIALPTPGKTNIHLRAMPGYQIDPSVLEHERVHAGQFKLHNIPSATTAKKLLLNTSPDDNKFMDETYGKGPLGLRNDAFEIPAVALTRDISKLARDNGPLTPVYDYLDEVYRKNPDKASLFEAMLPDRLVKQYIQDRPRPYPPTQLQRQLGGW